MAACGGQGPPDEATALALAFDIDAPTGGEQYECFGFDAAALSGRWILGIDWTVPPPGGVALHHAALYAVAEDYPAGPVPCQDMPAAWTMHVWAPGAGALTLPQGVAMALPQATRRLVVQAHVLRFAAGQPASASASIRWTGSAPEQVAAWLPALGGVPAIRPHSEEHSATICTASEPMHIFAAWPHMHLLGTAFRGSIVRADGTRATIVDVAPWNFERQSTYVVDRDVAAGEGVESACTWKNPTDAYVLPGFSTKDEMCGEGLIVWPASSAKWKTCL